MKLPLLTMFGLAAYMVWASTFADVTTSLLTALR